MTPLTKPLVSQLAIKIWEAKLIQLKSFLLSIGLVSLLGVPTLASAACEGSAPLTIVSATDDGFYEETHGPENSIDGDFDPDSRWSNLGQGEPKNLLLNLGAVQTVKSVGVAWYKGDQCKATYAIQASADGNDFATLVPRGLSAGKSLDLEMLDVEPAMAQFIRIAAEGNEANEWNSVVEVGVSGCGVVVLRSKSLLSQF